MTRLDNDALAAQVIDAPPRAGRPTRLVDADPAYLEAVLTAIACQLDDAYRRRGEPATLAVEALVAPGGHATGRPGHLISLRPLLTSAVVLGAILGRFASPHREIILVPPGGFGSGALVAYPGTLVSDPERRSGLLRVGGGHLRHARSAYDVAGAARHPALLGAASRYRPGADRW